MLDIKRIRDQASKVKAGIEARGKDASLIDELLQLDHARRRLLAEAEQLRNQRNRESREIGLLREKGAQTGEREAAARALGERIANLDAEIRKADEAVEQLLLRIPNVPHESVPIGQSSADNRVVREWGTRRDFPFQPRNHLEIGERLGILDLHRAGRMSGSGFPLFIGAGARLVRGLIQFMLDLHFRSHGYTEVWPPALCNSRAMTGTGQLPLLEDEMYRLPSDHLYLIPTAEVPLTNYYREEIIQRTLPIYLTAYTPCFRREAGAAGKATRGIVRVHQFDKVELVKFVEPENSYAELEGLVRDAEQVLRLLELPYRVVELCAADLSFAAAKCFDIEAWAPGQNEWLEVSSCSNFEDFQARRAGIRYRDADGRVRFVHTLNGSGVALPRLIVALLENFQEADGSVSLPEAVVPYMGGTRRLEPGRQEGR